MSQSVSLQLGTFGSLLLLAAFVVMLVIIVLYFVVWALRKKPVTGVESIKGKVGVVVSDLSDNSVGEVSVDGVIWKAKISDGSGMKIAKGESVMVVGITSLTLLVQRQQET